MPTVKDTADLLALKRRCEALTPGDQVRLAAECLDSGKFDIAETLLRNIADELAIVRIAKARGR